ncbi:nitrogen fixation negative regulator NifL [Thioalkalicoccus limnaeus]|uniref:histidine kinase n=1 Tax=Thioalkalicoccus limnaeus TaxID=120681 RepID=A0ABV4BEB9_9GAMM
MTAKGSSDPVQQMVANALAGFLAAPPPGTPPEVIEALTLAGDGVADPLPPRLFFEAVEQSPVAISITNAQAIILYANAAFEALTGYARAEVIGENESILSSNATPASVYQALWRTIKQKQTWTGTLVNRTKAGGDYLAELAISPVLDQDGAICYFLGIHRDVTRVHELEAALRQQKARVEAVLDAAPVVVVLLDDAGRLLLDNQEYRKLRGELGDREPIDLLRAALRKQAGFDPLEAALAERGFKDVEISLEVAGSGGPRWFACSGKPAHELEPSCRTFFGKEPAGERRLLLLANDITARRREIERAYLENLRARLAEQQLGHTMREALAAAIYQMQGPLNLIQAAAEMLKGGGGDPQVLSGLFQQISASGHKALATLQAALPEQPREAGLMVNINALLRQVLELETDQLLAAGIVVDWQPAHVLPEISGHKDQLRAMFKHLIDNAIQALNESGRTHRELRIATRVVDRSVEVVIQDNGPGIPSAQRYAVFEPFYIGWRHRRGRAGMGLPLTQEIVNQHGGSIEIDPEYHEGCRIRLYLTAVAED